MSSGVSTAPAEEGVSSHLNPCDLDELAFTVGSSDIHTCAYSSSHAVKTCCLAEARATLLVLSAAHVYQTVVTAPHSLHCSTSTAHSQQLCCRLDCACSAHMVSLLSLVCLHATMLSNKCSTDFCKYGLLKTCPRTATSIRATIERTSLQSPAVHHFPSKGSI